MRVISGSARRLILKTVEGNNIRPTTDRIKETLFNILGNVLLECTFLDIFSGSGGIGIEALSRGAKHVTFIDHYDKAIQCIKENLIHTKLDGKATVMYSNVEDAVNILNKGNQTFDIIFMDPPYNKNLEKKVLNMLSQSSIIHDNTLIVIEAGLDTDFDYVEEVGFVIQRVKHYKSNKHIFIQKGQ